MMGKIQTQLSRIQASSPSTSYAEINCTAPNSLPSNIRTLSLIPSTPLTMTDRLCYCTVDTSRVGEEDRCRAQLGTIRKAIEEEIRTTVGHTNWRCAAVSKDARNMDHIRVACRSEAAPLKVKNRFRSRR
jgi:hypothetical protein